MRDRQIQVASVERDIVAAGDLPSRGEQAQPSPLRKLHQKLRGRYAWAIVLAILGAGGAGYLGWSSTVPVYAGRGLIYIQPSMLTPKNPDGRVLPNFGGFVSYQVDLLRSHRATIMAMDTEEWKRVAQKPGGATIEGFERRRAILHRGGTSHIQLQFVDPDPEVALAGVQALIQAYLKLSEDLNDTNANLNFAKAQIELLRGKMKVNTDQIITRTARYGGVEGMQIRHRTSVKQILDTEQRLSEITGLILEFEDSEKTSETPDPIPYVEIAIENAHFASALDRLQSLQAEEEYLAETMGGKNETLVRLRRRIEVQRKRVDQLAEAWRRVRATKQAGGATLDELKGRKTRVAKRLESLQAQNRSLEETRVAVERLQATHDDLARQLADNAALKDELTAQLFGKGRIKIADAGSPPTSYYKDKRVTYAAAFGLLGAMVGVLVVLLIGLRDRRLKDAGDIDHSLARTRLLGLMPRIQIEDGDEEDQVVAAHCVHQIRTFLQIGHARQGGACICVSGPGAGSGKTTLTTALGLSFGSSGSRTLLIDADLSGRGLTWRVTQMLLTRARQLAGLSNETDANGSGVEEPRQLGRDIIELSMTRPASTEWPEAGELSDLLKSCIARMGLQDLKHSGAIDDIFALADLLFPPEVRDDLASVLMAALASEGYLTFGSPAEWIPPRVRELSAKQPDVNGSPLERYLYRTGVETVRFLPLRGLGRGGDVSAGTISKILDRVRGAFDVALVDTGPVPGTVETSMVAASADSVVLVVSPEDQRPDAERTVAHLEGIGADIAGFVFNRAAQKELLRSSMSRSVPHEGYART